MTKPVLPVLVGKGSSRICPCTLSVWGDVLAALQKHYELVYTESEQDSRHWLTSGHAKAVLAFDSGDVAGIVKETQFLQVC
jgi:hypothetical protein